MLEERDKMGLLIMILIFLGVMTMIIGIKAGEDIRTEKQKERNDFYNQHYPR